MISYYKHDPGWSTQLQDRYWLILHTTWYTYTVSKSNSIPVVKDWQHACC